MLTGQKIGLEDALVDILNKARRGLSVSVEELAERADVSVDQVNQVLQGAMDLVLIKKLAYVLNLHPDSLVDLAQDNWYPNEVKSFPGFAMFTTVFGDMTVNAYLVWDPVTKEAASFDTGSSCEPMLALIREHGLTLKRIFITHTHLDHLADLDRLQDASPEAISYGSAVENPLGLRPVSHGVGFVLGSLLIRILGTSGHTPGGLSYFIEGLTHPLVMVGDALFAGSMGGAAYAYQEALKNNRERVLTLPENTIICPGHGPLSTVAQERLHNPFFPEFKSIPTQRGVSQS